VFFDFYDDDQSQQVGVVVTQGGRVYFFWFDWYRRPVSEGAFTRWADVTDSWRDIYHLNESAAEALKHVEASGPN